MKLARRLPATTDPCGQITYQTGDDSTTVSHRANRLPVEPRPHGVRPLHDVFIRRRRPTRAEGDTCQSHPVGQVAGLDNMAPHADARRHDGLRAPAS